ncbi:MAG: hypothetical protein ACI4FN_06225 [Acutalibacteraceae bacterium]
MKRQGTQNAFAIICSAAFIVILILKPELCTKGAAEGLLLAGRVIIPSLFPFTACVLFIMKSGGAELFGFAAPFTKKIFHISPELFSIMLLSLIGGYPVGAKLLNEAVKSGKLSPENAGIMLNYCVNAGPAFVVLAVGEGIIGSKSVGYIMLAAHIISSLVLSVFFGFFIKDDKGKTFAKAESLCAADNFVASVSEAASAVFSVCAYVVFFSTVTEYIGFYTDKIPLLKYILPLLEVTNGVSKAKNIVIISFLLGFAGISIWCQILSVGRLIKLNLAIFALSRIVHGLISAALCALLLKIFGIAVFASAQIRYSPAYGGVALTLSMASMVIILLISLFSEKRTGNILKDIV